MNATLRKRKEFPAPGPLDYALAVVEAMGDAGLTQVPVLPSPAQVRAGARAGGVSLDVARAIYAAMIRESD